MSSKKIFRKLNIAAFGVGLFSCALCCLLPLIAVALGSASLLAAVAYLEKVGQFLLMIAILLTIYFWWQTQKKKACAVDCHCKTQASGE